MVNRSVGSRCSRRCAACFNNGGATLLNSRDEVFFIPSLINQIDSRFTGNFSLVQIRVLSCRVVAPHQHIGYVIDSFAGFLGNLCHCTVVIKTHHGSELTRVNVRCVALGNQSISVGWVAHYQHFNVAGCMIVDRFTLRRENSSVGFKQVFTLHARTTRASTYQQSVISIFEGNIRVVGAYHASQQRESTVIQLHSDAFQRFQSRGNFQHLQDNGLVSTQHLSGSNTEQQGIADLTSSASNGNTNRCFHNKSPN